jgi:hypothetical protein
MEVIEAIQLQEQHDGGWYHVMTPCNYVQLKIRPKLNILGAWSKSWVTKKKREANHNSTLQTLLYYSIGLYSDTFPLKSPRIAWRVTIPH